MNRRKIINLVVNIMMFVLVVFSLLSSAFGIFGGNKDHFVVFKYYTNWSNILGALAAILSIYYIIKDRKLPLWLSYLKLVALIMLTLTFLVVLLYLAPFTEAGWIIVYNPRYSLYVHVVVPILSVVDYLLLVNIDKTKNSIRAYALIPSLVYAIIIFFIVKAKGDSFAPYPFLRFNEIPWYISIIIIGMIALILYLFAWFYTSMILKTNKNIKEE